MAVEFIGAGLPIHGNNAYAYPYPTGTTAGDFLLLLVETAADGTLTTPSGWTLGDVNPSYGTPGSSTGVQLTWYWCFAGTESSVVISGSGYNHKVGAVITYRGVNPDMVPTATGATTTGSDKNVTWPGVTTAKANSLVINMMAHGYDNNNGEYFANWSNPDLVNGVEIMDRAASYGTGGGLVAYHGFKETPGPVRGTYANWDNDREWALATIVLEPSMVQTITSAGTGNVTVPEGVTAMRARVWGPGGFGSDNKRVNNGGGGYANMVGAGGGGGAVCWHTEDIPVTPGSVINYNIPVQTDKNQRPPTPAPYTTFGTSGEAWYITAQGGGNAQPPYYSYGYRSAIGGYAGQPTTSNNIAGAAGVSGTNGSSYTSSVPGVGGRGGDSPEVVGYFDAMDGGSGGANGVAGSSPGGGSGANLTHTHGDGRIDIVWITESGGTYNQTQMLLSI